MAEYDAINRLDHNDEMEIPHLKGENYVKEHYDTLKPTTTEVIDQDPVADESLLARGTQIAREIMEDARRRGCRRISPGQGRNTPDNDAPGVGHLPDNVPLERAILTVAPLEWARREVEILRDRKRDRDASCRRCPWSGPLLRGTSIP